MDDYNNEDVYQVLKEAQPEWIGAFGQPFDDNIELPDPIQIEWGVAVLDEYPPPAYSQELAITDADAEDTSDQDEIAKPQTGRCPPRPPPPLDPGETTT